MNMKIKRVNQEIKKGIQLEENIPLLLNYQANRYHIYAGIRLAMHYYSFYEAYCDDEELWSEGVRKNTAILNDIIQGEFIDPQGASGVIESVRRLDLLRVEIMKRMEALTSYTDIFQNYEYVLNRVEYRFSEKMVQVDEVEFSREILRYIFDSQDNYIVNEKIREMVGQLPIRMTKQRYFDLIKDSIYAYEGAQQSTLDSYLYMLQTCAMLIVQEEQKSLYPHLWEKQSFLAGLNYKNITKEEFEGAKQALNVATLQLETETNVYISMQEIVNELYSILLCKTYLGMTDEKEQELESAAVEIIRQINQLFLADEKKEISENAIESFSAFEGVQEELSYELVLLEEALFELEEHNRSLVDSLMLGSLLNALLRVKDLLSSSLFIDFAQRKSSEIVDGQYLQSVSNQIIEELTGLFSGLDKAVCRAVMANTLNKLPVFFQNHTEVMEYVRYSLEHCTNREEKAASIDIIREIMSE